MITLLVACEKVTDKLEQSSVEIPNRIITSPDVNLSEREGVLYLGSQKYSGYVIQNYPNKKLSSKNGYSNGKLEGKQEKWFENGAKMEVRYYSNNHKIGKHEGWYNNGQKRFEYFIENDVPIKTHREWHPNGQIFTSFNFNKDGQPEGTQQMWFPTGQIKANYVIKNGRRFGFLGAKGCMGENERKVNQISAK